MKHLLIIIVLLLSGCFSLKNISSVTSVTGSWVYIHNKSGCEEVYSFTNQGTLLTLSGGSLTIDSYAIDLKPNKLNRYKISGSGISVHGLADCSGRRYTEGANTEYTFYVEFHPDYPNEMVVYYDPVEKVGFGPLHKIIIHKTLKK